MTDSKKAAAEAIAKRITTLVDGDDIAIAVYPWKVYRFLLDDGRTVDVAAVRDDSDLRGLVLSHFKAGKIEGVALVGPYEPDKAEPESVSAPATKRTVKRAAAKKAS